jgi:hypothetical protein
MHTYDGGSFLPTYWYSTCRRYPAAPRTLDFVDYSIVDDRNHGNPESPDRRKLSTRIRGEDWYSGWALNILHDCIIGATNNKLPIRWERNGIDWFGVAFKETIDALPGLRILDADCLINGSWATHFPLDENATVLILSEWPLKGPDTICPVLAYAESLIIRPWDNSRPIRRKRNERNMIGTTFNRTWDNIPSLNIPHNFSGLGVPDANYRISRAWYNMLPTGRKCNCADNRAGVASKAAARRHPAFGIPDMDCPVTWAWISGPDMVGATFRHFFFLPVSMSQVQIMPSSEHGLSNLGIPRSG